MQHAPGLWHGCQPPAAGLVALGVVVVAVGVVVVAVGVVVVAVGVVAVLLLLLRTGDDADVEVDAPERADTMVSL